MLRRPSLGYCVDQQGSQLRTVESGAFPLAHFAMNFHRGKELGVLTGMGLFVNWSGRSHVPDEGLNVA